MAVRPGDILIALKAINLTPGLAGNDRAVAATLLDHFNRKTGQCDPSLERIAGLLGVHVRTVMRAMKRLEPLGFFRKTRHGGHLNRNSYEPVWDRFREVEAIWSARMKANSRSRAPAEMSPATRQPCHLGNDSTATQTCRTNLSKETCQRSPPKKEEGGSDERQSNPSIRRKLNNSDPARSAAERRWTNELHEQFSSMPLTYGEIIEAIDCDMQAAATDAEIRSRGAGFTYILNALKLGGRR
jgi:hypothetical protein